MATDHPPGRVAADAAVGGPDAATIAGLLADDDRRLTFAALVLGSATLDDVVSTTGLTQASAAKALGRLADAGLVIRGTEGGLHLISAVFQAAARAAYQSRPQPEATYDGLAPEAAKVMRTFVTDGRITQIPTSMSKRLVLLDWLAQDFEPGQRIARRWSISSSASAMPTPPRGGAISSITTFSIALVGSTGDRVGRWRRPPRSLSPSPRTTRFWGLPRRPATRISARPTATWPGSTTRMLPAMPEPRRWRR